MTIRKFSLHMLGREPINRFLHTSWREYAGMAAFIGGGALVLASLMGCSERPGQVAGAAITGYDAAVAAEIAYLETGKATPAQAICMRGVRLKADTGVKAVAAADKAGGATAAAVAGAQAAVDALAAVAANPNKGC